MKYAYSHTENGPWLGEYEDPASALASGRELLVEVDDNDEDIAPVVYIAEMRPPDLTQFLTDEYAYGVGDRLFSDAREQLASDPATESLATALEEIPANDLQVLRHNLKGVLEWWLGQMDILKDTQVAHGVVRYEPEAPFKPSNHPAAA